MTINMGRVTSTEIEDGVALLSVQMDRKGVEKRDVPVLTPLSGIVYVPEEGDMVAVDELRDGSPIVTGVLNRAEYEQPDHGEQEFSFVLDEDTELSVIKNGSGKYDVSISCSGSVEIESDDVVVGAGSENVVTDVSTITDGDGNVTDVEVETSKNVRVD